MSKPMEITPIWLTVEPMPCDHIRAYYQHLWEQHPCIAWNLLRHGYAQWSKGRVDLNNNLYDRPRQKRVFL